MKIEKTPIQKSGLRVNNCNIYIKRDDLIPYSFGGNKVRIAFEFYNDLVSKGYDTIVGYGSPESNLCRVVAQLSTRLPGGGYIVTSSDCEGADPVTANSVLSLYCGAKLVRCRISEVADTIDDVMRRLRSQGRRPYYIYGDKYGKGNELVPMNAYIKAYEEIREQEEALGLEFKYIFLATGTAMTQSGLLAGCASHGDDVRIVGISVARDAERVKPILKENCRLYFGRDAIEDKKFIVDDSYRCGGYGKYDDGIRSCIQSVYKSDSIPLDPVYTGKAFHGMLEYIKKCGIKGEDVLFLHTGGLPLFFDFLLEDGDAELNEIRLESVIGSKTLLPLIERFEKHLAPSLSERGIDLVSYARKIASQADSICLYRKGVAIGLCMFYARDPESISSFLAFLSVDPDARGKGMGSCLLKEFERLSVANGKSIFRLEVHKDNLKAIAFYRSHGYGIIQEHSTSSWLMEKKI